MGYRLTVAFQPASTTLVAGAGTFALTGGAATLTASGGTPAWVAALPDNQWTELTGSQSFTTWATAEPSLPQTGYLGSAFTHVIDAYSDWVLDEPNKVLYITGGGHFDSSNNGVYKFDPATLTYSVSVQPTPTDKYPPGYTAANGAITYPSGSNTDYFQTTDTLTDPADTPYAAPFAARRATHSYAATGIWSGRLVCHYNLPGYAVLGADEWENLGPTSPYGAQLVANGWAYSSAGNGTLQPGTFCSTDFTTGYHYVSNIPGDLGDNARSHILQIDPSTQTITRAWGINAVAAQIVQDANYVYAFVPNGNSTYLVAARINKTTWVRDFIGCDGVNNPPVASGGMETVPAFTDGSFIYFWHYATDKDRLYKVSLTLNGMSTLDTSIINLTASSMPSVGLRYRLHYIADWGVVLVLPSSSAKWWALKLA